YLATPTAAAPSPLAPRRPRCAPPPAFRPRQTPPRAPPAVVRPPRPQPQGQPRPVDPPPRPARPDPAAGLLPVGAQPQPAAEPLHAREPRQARRADLADQGQRRQLANPLDLGQVQARHVVQRRADVEARRVGPPLRPRLWPQR